VKCPFCGHPEDKVVDSREGKEGRVVRRRRECLSCARRFTTYERVDEIPYMVVKKDGRREPFDRHKLLTGLVKACEKRPVAVSALEAVVDEIENMLQESPEKELPATRIGERLMERLKEVDQVAYVRFASVYRQFGDLNAFMDELNRLLGQRKS
jgi:transcriptional repressor NrdR